MGPSLTIISLNLNPANEYNTTNGAIPINVVIINILKLTFKVTIIEFWIIYGTGISLKSNKYWISLFLNLIFIFFKKKLAFLKIREITIFFNNKKFRTPPVVIINRDIGILIYGENKKLEKIIIIVETGKITDSENSQNK